MCEKNLNLFELLIRYFVLHFEPMRILETKYEAKTNSMYQLKSFAHHLVDELYCRSL